MRLQSHVESCPSAMKLEPGVLENSYGGHQVAASSAPVVKLEQDKLLLGERPTLTIIYRTLPANALLAVHFCNRFTS